MAEYGQGSTQGLQNGTPITLTDYVGSNRGSYNDSQAATARDTRSDKGGAVSIGSIDRFQRDFFLQSAPTIAKYIMRGRDVDAVGVVYRLWLVYATPDLVGSSYTGPKSGLSPLADITILTSS